MTGTTTQIPETLEHDVRATIEACCMAHLNHDTQGARIAISDAMTEFFGRTEDDAPLHTAVWVLVGGALEAISTTELSDIEEGTASLVVSDLDGNQVNPDDQADPEAQGTTAALRMIAAWHNGDRDTAYAIFCVTENGIDTAGGYRRHMMMIYTLLNIATRSITHRAVTEAIEDES